jgi:hypothetical protein
MSLMRLVLLLFAEVSTKGHELACGVAMSV